MVAQIVKESTSEAQIEKECEAQARLVLKSHTKCIM